MSGVLCDRKISVRVEGNVYNSDIRPALVNVAETWVANNVQEKKGDVEMSVSC